MSTETLEKLEVAAQPEPKISPDEMTISVRDTEHKGRLTSSDGIFFLALLVDDVEMMLSQSDTISLSDALESLTSGTDESKSDADGKMKLWEGRLNQRIIMSSLYREAFCERVCEIFPTIRATGYVTHTMVYLNDGKKSTTFGLRIDAVEVMSDIIVPVLDRLFSDDYLQERKDRNAIATSKIEKFSARMAERSAQRVKEQEDMPQETQPTEHFGENFVDAKAETVNVWDEDYKPTAEELAKTPEGRERLQKALDQAG